MNTIDKTTKIVTKQSRRLIPLKKEQKQTRTKSNRQLILVQKKTKTSIWPCSFCKYVYIYMCVSDLLAE